MVANLAYDRWSRVIPDILAVQRQTEAEFLEAMPMIEKEALRLAKSDPGALAAHLTEFSNSCGSTVFKRWKDLAGRIMVKHNDGWLKKPGEMPKGVGYPDAWRRRVVKERGGEYVLQGEE